MQQYNFLAIALMYANNISTKQCQQNKTMCRNMPTFEAKQVLIKVLQLNIQINELKEQ